MWRRLEGSAVPPPLLLLLLLLWQIWRRLPLLPKLLCRRRPLLLLLLPLLPLLVLLRLCLRRWQSWWEPLRATPQKRHGIIMDRLCRLRGGRLGALARSSQAPWLKVVGHCLLLALCRAHVLG